MTCKELRLHFEERLRIGPFSKEAEHVTQCADCTYFVESRRELGDGLHLLRESVQQPSAALDAAVLGNYRQQTKLHQSETRSTAGRQRLAVVGSGLAATLLIAMLVVLQYERRIDDSIVSRQPMQPPPSLVQSANPSKGASLADSPRARRAPPTRNESRHHVSASVANAAPSVSTGLVIPEFHSLMYCDELSCGGTMQLIRIQLPPSAAALTPAGGAPDGIVYADVLVGADGIARGIHVEE